MSRVSRDNDWISSETEDKEADFSGLLKMHMRICKGVGSRREGLPYLYVDLYAGPGSLVFKGNEFEGSPLVFKRAVKETGIDAYQPIFCEIDDEIREQLVSTYGEPALMHADNQEFFDRGLRQLWRGSGNPQLGLIYYDPIRGEVPYQQLAVANRVLPKTDILLYVAATQYKRRHGYDPVTWPDHLVDHLREIGKKVCIVREPRGGNQYTFILLTNWVSMPAWTKRGFHRLDSEQGYSIMEKLNFSARELADREQY